MIGIDSSAHREHRATKLVPIKSGDVREPLSSIANSIFDFLPILLSRHRISELGDSLLSVYDTSNS